MEKKYYQDIKIDKINIFIIESIKKKAPLSVIRSRSEDRLIVNIHKKEKIDESLYNMMYINCGVYPYKDMNVLQNYYNENIKAIENADIFCYHYCNSEDVHKYLINNYNKSVKLGSYVNCSYPQNTTDSWINYLENKKVLVISCFAKTINNIYDIKKEKLNLPNFNLITYKPVQSIAKNKIHDSWTTSLNIMRKEISDINFDIALVSVGGYGSPLCNHIKNMGKIGIYMGGALQYLFKIKGERWKKNNDSRDDMWSECLPEEIPPNYKLVEGGCYW